jgi:hypothetical protein
VGPWQTTSGVGSALTSLEHINEIAKSMMQRLDELLTAAYQRGYAAVKF